MVSYVPRTGERRTLALDHSCDLAAFLLLMATVPMAIGVLLLFLCFVFVLFVMSYVSVFLSQKDPDTIIVYTVWFGGFYGSPTRCHIAPTIFAFWKQVDVHFYEFECVWRY